MSKLVPWLTKRREMFYEGQALQDNIDSFLHMVDKGAEVLEFDEAVIVLEDHGFEGNVRAWLLFDTFSRGVIRAMAKVSKEFTGIALYASTHDSRIKDVLVKMGYVQYAQDCNDYWLVKQGKQNGM
jgi:hypothetical protein